MQIKSILNSVEPHKGFVYNGVAWDPAAGDKTLLIDYKDSRTLGTFLSERGKIIPARITGNCARHQRRLTVSVKQARTVALLPYTSVYP